MLFGESPIAKWLSHPNLEIIRADFRLVDKVVEAVRGVDAVIHLGGIVGDPACSVDEDLTIDVNLAATRLLAQVARGEGVQRFVFASSCSVYGASDDVLSEDSETRPVSLYARTKLVSEQLLLDMADDEFAPVMLRFGTVYGLSGRPRFDLVINLLTAKAVTERKITVMGGDQWRPFVHVDDVAEAIFRVVKAPLSVVRNQTFNVGSDEQNLTIGQVAERIQRAVPEAEIVDLGRGDDPRNYRANFARIREALGFQPAWSIDDGIRQVRDALLAGQIGDYSSPQYSNVRSLLDDAQDARLERFEPNWPLKLLNGEGSRSDSKETGRRAGGDGKGNGAGSERSVRAVTG
jgi:nucleoside-diphosphate-sugar epimerase